MLFYIVFIVISVKGVKHFVIVNLLQFTITYLSNVVCMYVLMMMMKMVMEWLGLPAGWELTMNDDCIDEGAHWSNWKRSVLMLETHSCSSWWLLLLLLLSFKSGRDCVSHGQKCDHNSLISHPLNSSTQIIIRSVLPPCSAISQTESSPVIILITIINQHGRHSWIDTQRQRETTHECARWDEWLYGCVPISQLLYTTTTILHLHIPCAVTHTYTKQKKTRAPTDEKAKWQNTKKNLVNHNI